MQPCLLELQGEAALGEVLDLLERDIGFIRVDKCVENNTRRSPVAIQKGMKKRDADQAQHRLEKWRGSFAHQRPVQAPELRLHYVEGRKLSVVHLFGHRENRHRADAHIASAHRRHPQSTRARAKSTFARDKTPFLLNALPGPGGESRPNAYALVHGPWLHAPYAALQVVAEDKIPECWQAKGQIGVQRQVRVKAKLSVQ